MKFSEILEKAKTSWKTLDKAEKPQIIVGAATCGRAAGALEIIEVINAELARLGIDADVTQVGCIGICYAEPLVDIIKPGKPRICYSNVTPDTVRELLEAYLVNDDPRPELAMGTFGDKTIEGIPRFWEEPMLKPQVRIALRNCGIIDPEKIDHYIARGGYAGLHKALSFKPQQVIDEVKKSGLCGRGGAGFPTGLKWQFCADAPGDKKYIIFNADEGDPGAFMDRSLLEGDPHAVLEGMLIGAYAMGADEGYIYCRAEYPLAITRLQKAIEQMEAYGLIGDNILGTGFNFQCHIKEGAGAFVCGEETALMASIEGKRGMPRPRPPFPANAGLWGKPTNINNVETWANVSAIMQHDGDWYAGYGTKKSKGTKTFALAGKINRTGLIEVPMGLTLREIVYDIGGGIPDGKEFKAVQTGGPSGGCLPADKLDLPVDYESLKEAGAIMGSGGMVVMDQDTCMVDVARYFLTFTQSESCGKCVPCRVGTKQMLDILERICAGQGQPEDIALLERLGDHINAGALCALGQTAPNPVRTTMKYFYSEYTDHIEKKRCPALSCTELVSFYVDPAKCIGCGMCARNCPVECIAGGKKMVHVIDQEKCIKCGTCYEVCPKKVRAVTKVSGETLEVPAEPIPVTAGSNKSSTSE